MATAIQHFELNTGAKIPSVGLGTWQAEAGVVGDAVTAAIKVVVFFISNDSLDFVIRSSIVLLLFCQCRLVIDTLIVLKLMQMKRR